MPNVKKTETTKKTDSPAWSSVFDMPLDELERCKDNAEAALAGKSGAKG